MMSPPPAGLQVNSGTGCDPSAVLAQGQAPSTWWHNVTTILDDIARAQSGTLSPTTTAGRRRLRRRAQISDVLYGHRYLSGASLGSGSGSSSGSWQGVLSTVAEVLGSTCAPCSPVLNEASTVRRPLRPF
jgi:hypothetical protein